MKFDRNDLKEQLRQRAQESYDSKDDGGKFGKYWSGVPYPKLKVGDGEHVMDILMFPAGENYPIKSHLKNPPKPTDWVTWLDIWIHQNVGPNEDMVVCNASSYGEPCYICEDVAKMRKMNPPDEQLIKDTKAKRRCGYLVISRDSAAEEAKGIQFAEYAHYHMEKELAKKARKPFGGGYILYADPFDGKTVYYKKEGKGLDAFSEHQFMDRDYEIPDEILSQIQPLANFLVRLSYDEVKKLYQAGKDGTPCESPYPREEEESHYNPPTRTPKKAPVDAEPEPEPEQEEQDLNQESESKPEPTPSRRARRPVQDTTQEEVKEEPPRRSRKPVQEEPKQEPSSDKSCPGGGVFGVDIDKLTHCGPCEEWDNCATEAQRLETVQKK